MADLAEQIILDSCKEAFLIFDKNNDGTISVSELAIAMRSLGQNPTKAEVESVIKDLSADGKGSLNLEEFTKLILRGIKEPEKEQEDLKAAFRAFDKDGNGFVTVDELMQALTSIGEKMSKEEASKMISYADTDHDGKLNYEEYAKMMLAS